MNAEQVKQLILTGLPHTTAHVNSDDDVHFDAIVISEAFVGKTSIKRHQMVFATLGDKIQSNEIHALSLKTYTPEQWQTLNRS
jgi:acid stress-induced BolA-like protein IbaG/YrbA